MRKLLFALRARDTLVQAVPMAFGVLTTDTWEQAEARAGVGRDNKGFEAAAAALEMAELFGALRAAARR